MVHQATCLWSQRSQTVMLTIEILDIIPASLSMDIQPNHIHFTGKNTQEGEFQFSLDLYADIDPNQSKYNVHARGIHVLLWKKNEAWWPRCWKDGKKPWFIKTDFEHWVDEDEQEEVAEQDDMGMGGAGIDWSQFANMSGMGNDIEDDEDMPSLEDPSKASSYGQGASSFASGSYNMEKDEEEDKDE